MKVYGVTEGTYSDYHVLCLFTKKEYAQDYIDSITRNLEEAKRPVYPEDYAVEEFELFDMVPVLHIEYFSGRGIVKDEQGNVVS